MKKPKPSPTRDEHFDRIEASPEELAKVFLRTPTKKPEDWDYMREVKDLPAAEHRPRVRQAAPRNVGPFVDVIDAVLELGAYEKLWSAHNVSFKSIAEIFAQRPDSRLSDFVEENEAREIGQRVVAKAGLINYKAIIKVREHIIVCRLRRRCSVDAGPFARDC